MKLLKINGKRGLGGFMLMKLLKIKDLRKFKEIQGVGEGKKPAGGLEGLPL